MMTLLQGDGPEIDSRIWYYLIFAALSVIGALFGKKKKEEAEEAKRRQRQGRAPKARQTAPPRVPMAPRPPRSAPTFPEARPPRPRPAPTPRVARPPGARPAQVPRRPVEARPSPLRGFPGTHPSLITEPDALTAEAVEGESRAEELVTLPSDLGAPRGPVKRVPRGPGQSERVRRLLGDRSGLRTAFILSEILAPPVGLRENRQV